MQVVSEEGEGREREESEEKKELSWVRASLPFYLDSVHLCSEIS